MQNVYEAVKKMALTCICKDYSADKLVAWRLIMRISNESSTQCRPFVQLSSCRVQNFLAQSIHNDGCCNQAGMMRAPTSNVRLLCVNSPTIKIKLITKEPPIQ